MSKKNYLIDRDGNPYIENESSPAGGGLDKRCDYNKEAVHAFDLDVYDCADYLDENGFELVEGSGYLMEVWEKGNTRIVLEDPIDGLYGYVHTEYIKTKK